MLRDAKKAVDALIFVGVQEAYDVSVEILLREFHTKLSIPLPKERSESDKKTKEAKAIVQKNSTLLKKAEKMNSYDMRLYKYGTNC
jgi:hypothetical protein